MTLAPTRAFDAATATPVTPVTPVTPAPYLEIEGLSKVFGDFTALDDISLSISRGEFICFLGPSGCGKTTLLRTIAGLDPQTRGRIRQGGRDVSLLPASKRDYGIVFQSYALFPNLTVWQNVAFGLKNTGRSKAEIAARVAELLALVGLPDKAGHYPAQLSGGQQQRIALARAIAIDPGLLLLDEPLSALDAKVRIHLRHEIKELQRRLGVTTIMVTHDQEEALAMADRIVVMNHGVIEQVGTPTEIYRHPDSLFVAGFIGEANRFDAVWSAGRVRTKETYLSTTTRRQFRDGSVVAVAIRPEDVVPHPGRPESVNALAAEITDMEFLGAHWRAHLMTEIGPLIASVSMTAMRRMLPEIGSRMFVELPADRVLVFPHEG